MWRFRGTPHYLAQQARRLGITQVLADRARSNPEIYRVSVLLGQVCERCNRARQEAGMPAFNSPELAQVEGTLEQCEQELGKLHALAAAAQVMLDEAWAAVGLIAPARHFAILSDYDDDGPIRPPPPLGDGTVGIPDDDGSHGAFHPHVQKAR